MAGKKFGRDIVHRWEGNPAISLEDLQFRCSDILSAGVACVDGRILLLITIENLEGTYYIYPAWSEDGYHFDVSDEPLLAPSTDERTAVYEELGVLDARVTFLEDAYYICYDAYGRHGYRLALARTEDFRTIERLGCISEPDTKGGALFPRKIKGKYARLERPWETRGIWVSYSEDLKFWGESEIVMTPREGYWDRSRLGAATPPVEIDEGWLLIYYGVKDTSAGPLFRLGAAMLDKENPARVVGRTNVPILSPREEYERVGNINNLVFSCGAIIETSGEVRLYYGAAKSDLCIGTTRVETIVKTCLESTMEY